MTQAQAVIETIDKLGGIATLNQINQHIFEIEECEWKTKTPFASIRRIVQLTKGIYKIKPGLYALESHRKGFAIFPLRHFLSVLGYFVCKSNQNHRFLLPFFSNYQ